MPLSIEVIVLLICWGTFFLTWGLGWVYNLVKAPQSQPQSRTGSSIDYVSIVAIAVVFLLNRFVRVFSPDFALHFPLWVETIGGIFLIAATGLALWSRFTLGTMWSARPVSKVGHELRTSGPYAISRHPIYTGIIGMALGSVLLSSGNGLVILVTLLVIFRLLPKIPVEEKLMIEKFGEQYLTYQKQVPQLIPDLQWWKKNKSVQK